MSIIHLLIRIFRPRYSLKLLERQVIALESLALSLEKKEPEPVPKTKTPPARIHWTQRGN